MDLLGFVLEKCGEGFSWLKSQIETFFKSLSKNVGESFTRLKRFYDNFSEEFKHAVATSKAVIEAAMEKVFKAMVSMNNLFYVGVKKTLTSLKNLMYSIAKELKRLFDGLKSFICLMKEAAIKTANRFRSCSSEYFQQKFKEFYKLALWFGDLLSVAEHKPMRLFRVVYEAGLLFMEKPNLTYAEKMSGFYFKNLENEKEKRAAVFVYFFIVNGKNLGLLVRFFVDVYDIIFRGQ